MNMKEPSYEEGLNGVVGKSTTEDMISNGLMENITKLWGEDQPLMESINLIENTKEMKNFFHQDDKE